MGLSSRVSCRLQPPHDFSSCMSWNPYNSGWVAVCRHRRRERGGTACRQELHIKYHFACGGLPQEACRVRTGICRGRGLWAPPHGCFFLPQSCSSTSGIKFVVLLRQVVNAYDKEYQEQTDEIIFQTILAANFLDIKSLLELMCKKVPFFERSTRLVAEFWRKLKVCCRLTHWRCVFRC